MRILVTGATNPYGAAVAHALAEAGHVVRAFGIPAGEDPFHSPSIECFPGVVENGGSIEPVAVECQVIVHCANLDLAGTDSRAHRIHIQRGTLYTRYGAERELVNAFVALFPQEPQRAWRDTFAAAESHVRGTRPSTPYFLLHVGSPNAAAKEVLALLAQVRVPA